MTNSNNIDFATIIPKFDEILKRGLCIGKGKPDGQMCVEAAICTAMDLPFGDEPDCVTPAIRNFKLTLNDLSWFDPIYRAKGLRDLGIAQIGSKGVVDGEEFNDVLKHKFITTLIPTLIREIYSNNQNFLDKAKQLEETGKLHKIYIDNDDNLEIILDECDDDIWPYSNTNSMSDFIRFINYAYAYAYANNKVNKHRLTRKEKINNRNKYLLMAAELALDTLKELKSPGCDWL